MAYDYDVFISYSHKDEDWVRNILLPVLEQRGVKVCIDYRDFLAGRPAIVNMQEASEKSRHTLLVLTPRWVESEWTRYEAILTRTDDPAGLQRRTIPLLLEKCSPPKFISILSWVDFTDQKRQKEAWESLFKSLEITAPTPEPHATAAGSGLPLGSYLPFNRNALFTGREEDLEKLAENLLTHNGANTLISQAVTGMGGLGKTQLAVEFAYRYGHRFKGVHWLDLRDPSALDGAIAQCGSKMGYTQQDQRELVASTLKAWVEDGPRLLILDNVEDAGHVNEVLARFQHPSLRVLVTSRRRDFPRSSGLQVQKLGVFSAEESASFLEKTLEQEETVEAREKLADKLGCLPLALELAAGYMNIARIRIEGYLRELADVAKLEAEQAEWFRSLEVANPTEHEQSLFGTFRLSWQEVQDEAQQKVFLIAGYLAPNTPIPLEIFQETLGLEEKELAKALYRLNALGLLPVTDQLPSIHPLLAAFARTLSSKELLETLADKLSVLARQANDQMDQTGSPGWFAPLRPHVLAAVGIAEEVGLPDAASLLGNLGYYLHKIADYKGAESAHKRALKIRESIFGTEHEKVATSLNNLGSVLYDQGDLAGARAAYERALEIDQAIFGPDHPKVAIRVNNLGLVLKELGDLAGARAAYERALRIDEATYGPYHPDIATAVNNLGSVLQDLGDLAGARAAFERALKIDEAVYGLNHPSVAREVNNLGGVLYALGDLVGARAAFERALRIFKHFLPEGHPNIRTVQENLDSLPR